jgi:hypothetical protein
MEADPIGGDEKMARAEVSIKEWLLRQDASSTSN